MPGWGEDLCGSGGHQGPASARWSEVDLAGHLRCDETAPEGVKMLQLVCDGPPGAHRPLFDLEEIGGIPSKGAYPPRSKVAKLPFNGAATTPVALVRSELCVTEKHGAERAEHMQHAEPGADPGSGGTPRR